MGEFVKITGTPRQRAAIAAVLASVAGTGSYGRALAAGEARWSGADLRGKAREWGARYAQRRAAIMGELARRGVVVDRQGAVLHLSAATHRVTIASGALAGLSAFAVARGRDFVLARGGVCAVSEDRGGWYLGSERVLVERASMPA